MLTVAIVFMIMASVLYTVAIWTEKISKKLKLWIVFMFGIAFTCDLIGTSMMFLLATIKFKLCLHTSCGYVALGIMAAHFIFAILTIVKSKKYEKYFTMYSIVAWIIWLIAFFSGIPKI